MISKRELIFRIIDLEDICVEMEESIMDLRLRVKVLEDNLIKPKKTTKKRKETK